MKKYVRQLGLAFLLLMLCITPSTTIHAAKLNKTSLTLYTGQTYRLKVSGDKLVSCKSTNTAVASINNQTGLITAKKAGTCTIKVNTQSSPLSCIVTVKKTVELSKYFSSYAKFKNAVGYMRQATAKEEPVTYTGTLYFGSGASVSNGNFFIRTDKPGGKVICLQNLTKKQFTLYGVRIGDSVTVAHKILLKNGLKFNSTQKYTSHTLRRYKKDTSTVILSISDQNKVLWYQWYR